MLVGVALIGVVAVLVARDGGPGAVAVIPATDPVAPVGLGDGRVAWGERTTGEIRVVPAREPDTPSVLFAEVPDALRTDGQRGLLGLAAREEEGGPIVYASWTRADDGRLVVGRLPEGAGTDDVRLVWEGPVTTDLANGGTLAFRGPQLLIGVGELQDPDAALDPSTPNGKVLALDPSGPADQEPSVVAAGWHNPFALTVVGDDVWLLDNAPGAQPERLARIPRGAAPTVVDLDGRRAPSALVADRGSLLVCGYVSGVVERFPLPRADVRAGPVTDTGWPCATGLAVVEDRIVTTTVDEVQIRVP